MPFNFLNVKIVGSLMIFCPKQQKNWIEYHVFTFLLLFWFTF